jgi:feruloyl esterase
MKRLVLFVLCSFTFPLPVFAANCESLAGLSLPHGKVTVAVGVLAGDLSGLTPKPLEKLPAFCRVAATLMPSSDSNTRIEVWMPVAGWNGKYEGTGNGGYAGGIAYGGLAAGLRRGYAVANTDLGTSPMVADNSDVLVGHPEKWRDWGSRATHEMTVAAKLIVRAYYGHDPALSYYVGCSTGGQQGLVEAQRFPDDFDGILAGAPANNRTRLHMGFIWDQAVAEETPQSYIPAAKLQLMSQAVLTACAQQKAAPTDAFLTRPADCHWDPQSLLCKAGDSPDCLTSAQVTTAKKLYDGPRNPVTYASIYPGLTRGSELDWDSMMPQGAEPRFDALFKWTFGAKWDWRTFDFNRDVKAVDNKLAATVNATDPDLQTFKAHGHKLIVYHGWADVLVPSLESIRYYRSVENAQHKQAASGRLSAVEETQAFYRLFMIPGMAHCSGGPGLNSVDPLEALEQWVEKGIAPEKIIAKRTVKGVTEMTRPACPYPQVADYSGSGDTNDAANFMCTNPTPGKTDPALPQQAAPPAL